MIVTEFGIDVSGIPPGLAIATDQLAVSKSGTPLSTINMFNCVGVVVHNPMARQGCLGHVSPDGEDSAREYERASAFLNFCITDLLGVRPADAQTRTRIEVLITGGGARGPSFEVAWAMAYKKTGIAANNWYDGLRLTEQARAASLGLLGQVVPGGFTMVYNPRGGEVWVSSALSPPPFLDDQTTTQPIDLGNFRGNLVNAGVLRSPWSWWWR